MKHRVTIFFLSIALSVLFSSGTYAMSDIERSHPRPSEAVDDIEYVWTWLNDDYCVNFRTNDSYNRQTLEKFWNIGILRNWTEKINDEWEVQKRDTYSGKWSQDTAGIWSFVFDDYTIPVGPTNIDGVVYAFNGYGQLVEGYNYWGDLTTGPDGLVVTDNPEFLEWLATQYLPECTSHE